MIIDVKKFVADERQTWSELERLLDVLEKDPGKRLNVTQVKQFHYLYQRASADLSRIKTFSTEQSIHRYLEALVGKAYGEVHGGQDQAYRFSFFQWFFKKFPGTFRKYYLAFILSLAIMSGGVVLGGVAVSMDPEAKEILMPFPHLMGDPSERVAHEEQKESSNGLKGSNTTFSSYLMTHNTRISILTLALGMTWGIGTVILLFSNGVMLGAVAFDYMMSGETWFLMGWLLPHGVIEIPAILLAGQAGFVLAGALIGWGRSVTLKDRLRTISGDIVTLIFGVGIMLVWAGLIEAFFSQIHEPVVPYALKIGFGVAEFIVLTLFLGWSGSERKDLNHDHG